jgi:outer membrane protein OmpA-like peptidoglycan-associated protein
MTPMNRHSPLLIIAAAVLFAACATTKSAQKGGLAKGGAGKNGSGAAEGAPAAPATNVTEASLRTGGFEARAELKSVPFDYDSAKLSGDALAVLKANAEVVKADPDVEVLVAGQ